MPNQEDSRDGIPRVDSNRPSPDVERYATDGQTNSRGKGASDEQGEKIDDQQAGAVSPSSLNQGDRGVADTPTTTSELDFDDSSEERPRGDNRRTGGTWDSPAHNTGDQGEVGPAPGAGLSDRNGPSDPDAKKGSPVS